MPSSHTHPATSSQTRTGSRSSSRAESAAFNEIVNLLKNDHKQVKRAFRDFEKLDPHTDEEECQSLVTQTCRDLEIHTTLEEELFYPAARDCLGDESLIEEAEIEHMSAKMLIGELKNMSPDDEKFAATFKVLGEYVNHHIREEENEIFPQLAHAKHHWQDLQAEISERREELEEQLGAQSPTRGRVSASQQEDGGSRTRKGGNSQSTAGKKSASSGAPESDNEQE